MSLISGLLKTTKSYPLKRTEDRTTTMTTPSEEALNNPELMKKLMGNKKFRAGATPKEIEEINKNLPLDSINSPDNPWRKKQ